MTAAVPGPDHRDLPIAIVGGGSIGVGFAIVFACARHPVRLSEPDAARRLAIPALIRSRLVELEAHGLIDEPVEDILARVALPDDLTTAVEAAVLILECAPERRDVKTALFNTLDRLTPPTAILASASSAIPASDYAADLPGRARVLVIHPGNPPFLIRVVEVVPAAFTSAETVAAAEALLTGAGLTPVLVRREIEGFVFNRLQGALLREAYCLVRDGVASVDDIDRIVRDGLGLRWSVIGPFESVDLNTRGGITAHAERMGPAYARMGAERGQNDPWTPDLVAKVAAERRARLPLEQWEERVAWRDRRLMALVSRRRLETEA